jgi:hypothetical protein
MTCKLFNNCIEEAEKERIAALNLVPMAKKLNDRAVRLTCNKFVVDLSVINQYHTQIIACPQEEILS